MPQHSVLTPPHPNMNPLNASMSSDASQIQNTTNTSSGGMRIERMFTTPGSDPLEQVVYEKRTSRINNTDGSVVFEMEGAEIPKDWSQVATDIVVSKYFRKAGVPQFDEAGQVMKDEKGEIITGPERTVRQVVRRLAGCWRHWGQQYGYFDTAQDAQTFEDELSYMLIHQDLPSLLYHHSSL